MANLQQAQDGTVQMIIASPRLQRDWMGKRVTLIRDVTTTGGDHFKAGELCEVVGVHRGKVEVWAIPHERLPSGGIRSVRGLRFADLQLVAA